MREVNKGVALSILVLILNAVFVAAQDCNRLRVTSTYDDLVSYLGKPAPTQVDAECIAFAINRLGEKRYEPAIPVLLKFLDFRWPRGAWQKQHYYLKRPNPSNVYVFPAAKALEAMGKSALPALLEVIKTGTTSRVGSETAVTIWMANFENQRPRGVALLKQEADVARDPGVRLHLLQAVARAADWCGPADEAQCVAAARAHYAK